MGACRAVSRMRRRSRARRPAHGVRIVSFLRLAQRSRRALGLRRVLRICALLACPAGVLPWVLVAMGNRRVRVGRMRLGAWARRGRGGARVRAHGASEGACVARPGISLRPVWAAMRCASRRLCPVRVRKAPPPLSPSARLRASRGPGPAACVPGRARVRFARASRFLCARVLSPVIRRRVRTRRPAPRAPPFRRSLWLDLRP